MSAVVKQRCQRIGCPATFTDDENLEGCCHFHPGPLFHDGRKEWSCCKQRSHDFTLFLDLPTCQTGKHSSEKPQPTVEPLSKKPVSLPAPASEVASSCSRCKQGFFCSDHGSKPPLKVNPPVSKTEVVVTLPKVVDLNTKQICKNEGCGKMFTEKENTDSSCQYHPGPAVFRDRQKGWTCCNIHVKDFEEFLTIPPCSRGWHNANPAAKPVTQ